MYICDERELINDAYDIYKHPLIDGEVEPCVVVSSSYSEKFKKGFGAPFFFAFISFSWKREILDGGAGVRVVRCANPTVLTF